MSSIDVHPLSAYDNEKDSEKAMGHETNVAVVAVAALHDPVFGDLEANGPNYRDVCNFAFIQLTYRSVGWVPQF
jgi:hypothetical protein